MMRRTLAQLGLLLAIILFGTGIDFVTHHLRDAWYVEPEYYWAKILFGLLWAYLGFLALKHVLGVRSWKGFAWGVPAVVALVLQTKYFYQGRDLGFVVVFLFLHYLMFLPASLVVFRRRSQLFLAGALPPTPSRGKRWLAFIALGLIVEGAFAFYFLSQYGWLR